MHIGESLNFKHIKSKTLIDLFKNIYGKLFVIKVCSLQNLSDISTKS